MSPPLSLTVHIVFHEGPEMFVACAREEKAVRKHPVCIPSASKSAVREASPDFRLTRQRKVVRSVPRDSDANDANPSQHSFLRALRALARFAFAN